jgi:hypothetical protein
MRELVATLEQRTNEKAHEALARSAAHLARSEDALRRSMARTIRDQATIDRESAASVRAEGGARPVGRDT